MRCLFRCVIGFLLLASCLPQANPSRTPSGGLFQMIVESDFVASGSMDEGTPILERLTEEELAGVTDLGAIKSGILYRFQIKRLFIDRAEIFRGVGKARSDLAAFLFRRRENLLPIPHAPDEYARFKGGVESIWFAVNDPAGEELREIYNIPTGLPLFRTLNAQAGLVKLSHPPEGWMRALRYWADSLKRNWQESPILGAIKSGTLYRFQIKRLFIDRAEIFRGVGKARSDLAAFLFRRRENLLPIPHAPDEYARFKGGVESIWFAVNDPAGEELREIYNIPTGLPLFRTLNAQAGLVKLSHPSLEAVRALAQVLVQPTIEARIEALRELGKSQDRLLRSEALEGIRYLETTRADRK